MPRFQAPVGSAKANTAYSGTLKTNPSLPFGALLTTATAAATSPPS